MLIDFLMHKKTEEREPSFCFVGSSKNASITWEALESPPLAGRCFLPSFLPRRLQHLHLIFSQFNSSQVPTDHFPVNCCSFVSSSFRKILGPNGEPSHHANTGPRRAVRFGAPQQSQG